MFATSKEPKLQPLVKNNELTEEVKKLSQKLYITVFPNEGVLDGKKKRGKKKSSSINCNVCNIIAFLTKFIYFRKSPNLAEKIQL